MVYSYTVICFGKFLSVGYIHTQFVPTWYDSYIPSNIQPGLTKSKNEFVSFHRSLQMSNVALDSKSSQMLWRESHVFVCWDTSPHLPFLCFFRFMECWSWTYMYGKDQVVWNCVPHCMKMVATFPRVHYQIWSHNVFNGDWLWLECYNGVSLHASIWHILIALIHKILSGYHGLFF